MEPKLTGLWCYNSLLFNLFFCFLFLFVCLFPWFWLLSFLRRYVHLLFPNASSFLSSQVLLVVHHAFVLFLIFFFLLHLYSKVFIYFYRLSVHWLIWTSDVCLFSLSLSQWFVHTLLSLWVVAGRSPSALATPWTRLGELMLCDHLTEQFDPLFSVCCGGHSLDLCFLEAALYLFFHSASTTKDFSLTFQRDHEPIYPLARCCLLSGCMEREYCTFSIT